MSFRFALIALAMLSGQGKAADLDLVSYHFSDETPSVHLRLSGPIQGDDPERIAAQFERLARCSGESCSNAFGGVRAVVSLSSPGGSYSAGVKLADFFRANQIATIVETGDACLSACAVAFLGGSGYWLTAGVGTFIDRTIEPGARLGFHSPYFSAETAQKAAIAGKLDQLLTVTRLSIADIVKTLTRYNVSQHVLDQIIRMGPDGFYEVDTPAALFGIRARLPSFDPTPLGLPWSDQVRNVCERLVALHYGREPVSLPPFEEEAVQQAKTNDDTDIILHDLYMRPINVSGCGIAAAARGRTVTGMSLYRWDPVEDRHHSLLDYQNGVGGGWSLLGYRGGRATDGFLTLGTLNHMLMSLDYDLSRLPNSIRTAILRARGRDTVPGLPKHSRDWPVESGYQTPWSRVSFAAGLTIVEQTGSLRLFDELALQAQETEVMFERTGETTVVRSGQDLEAGTSYYWFGLKSGDRAATVRIEAPVLAAELSKAQKDLMGMIACSSDFGGTHLGCYR